MTRHLGDVGPSRVSKSGHATITKIEKLHIDVEKFTDSKNAILVDLRRKITKLSRKNCFRTAASSGACERLDVFLSCRIISKPPRGVSR